MIALPESYNLKKQSQLDGTLLAVAEQDPIFFANWFLGIHLNPFNVRALMSVPNHKQIIWVTANQVGKTVTLACLHIWFNYFKKGFNGDPKMIEKARYETLNLSPISRQSKEAFRYVIEILSSEFSWEEDGKRYINECRIGWFLEGGGNETLGRIDFSNNSSCHCLSTSADAGAGLAGKQFAVISYDECDQSHHLEDELGARIMSRTAKYSGWVILVATPDEMAKSQQYWYHLYTTAKRAQEAGEPSEWFLVEGLYNENIFIPEEKRQEFMKRLFKLSPVKYAQVIEGKFLAAADRAFTPEMVEGLWNSRVEPTDSMPDRDYVEIIDWGVADTGDETVMGVGDITDIDDVVIVKAYSKQGGDPIELMAMATFLRMEYNDCPIVMDAAEMGGIVFKKMMKQFKPISFGQGNKPEALFFIQLRLRNNLRTRKVNEDESAKSRIKSYRLPKLEKQLSTYKFDDKRIKQDWVMMLAMLAWYVEKYKRVNRMQSFSLTNFYKSQSSNLDGN